MKTGEFLNALATAAGVPSDDANLKKILSSVTVSEAEIPDTLANKIQESLLTVESAKAHPEVNKHFRQAHLSRIDKDLEDALKTLEVDDATLAEINGAKSTFLKIPLALQKIADLKTKAAEAKAGGLTGKAAEYEAQVLALKKANEEIITNFKSEKEALLAGFDNERKDTVLNSILSGYDYAGEQPKEVSAQVTKFLLDKKLKELGYQTKFENGNIELLTSDGTKPYDNKQQLITLKGLTDTLVSENKLIKVKGANTSGNQAGAAAGSSAGSFQAAATGNTALTPFDTHLKEQLASLNITQQ